MAFLWASLDDSADAKRRDIFVVGGFVSRQDIWTDVERYWQKRLEQEDPPLPYFRATDCKSRSQAFRRFRDKTKYTREEGIAAARAIRDDLKLILKSSNLVAFGHGILMSDYRKVRQSARARRIFASDPYVAGYQQMMVRLATKAADVKETIAFLCDDHNLSGNVKSIYDAFRTRSNPVCGQWMGSLSFKSDRESPALQAADLFSSICKDVFLEGLKGSKDRPLLDQLREWKHISVSIWNEEIMRKIVAANMGIKGRPSIFDKNQLAFFDVNDSFIVKNQDNNEL